MQTQSNWRGHNLTFRDQTYSLVRGTSLWELCPAHLLHDPNVAHVFEDRFRSADHITYTQTDDGATGATAYLDQAGGGLTIKTAANDNDYNLKSTAAQNWLFAAAKPAYFEVSMTLTEANVNDANWVIGLSDTIANGFLQDNGAGPAASYDGAVFFKVDGTMNIQFETSNAGTQVTTAAVAAFVSAQTYRVGFVFDPADGTTGSITPYLDGVAGTAHAITLAGLAEMSLIYGIKAGDTNVETLQMNYARCVQVL